MKKTSVVVGVTLAGMLALSPLAAAATPAPAPPPAPHRGAEQVVDPGGPTVQNGLLNLRDLNLLNGVNVCPGLPVAAGLGNLLGILAIGGGGAGARGGNPVCANAAAAGGLPR